VIQGDSSGFERTLWYSELACRHTRVLAVCVSGVTRGNMGAVISMFFVKAARFCERYAVLAACRVIIRS